MQNTVDTFSKTLENENGEKSPMWSCHSSSSLTILLHSKREKEEEEKEEEEEEDVAQICNGKYILRICARETKYEGLLLVR